MKLYAKSFLTGLILIGGLFACSDHRLTQLTGQNIRLKTRTPAYATGTPGLIFGQATFELIYDNSNRLSNSVRRDYTTSYSRVDYSYDAQNRLIRYDDLFVPGDPSVGRDNTRTEIIYNADGKSATVKLSTTLDNFKTFTPIAQQTLEFNNKGQVVRVTSASADFDYTYFNDNVISVLQTERLTGRGSNNIITNRRKYLYEYDDRVNPVFGMPDNDQTNQKRFNKNNVIKITEEFINNTTGAVDYRLVLTPTYTYNAQGLPTSLFINGLVNNGQLLQESYTYETY